MVELEEEIGERITFSMGWLPDYPDFRDYTEDTEEIKDLLTKTSVKPHKEAGGLSFPTTIDLREWCSPIENQGDLGSCTACTAQAGVGLMEYLQIRAFKIHTDASRLFLYKATRNLLHWTGDTGAFLRTTMGAMRLFGVPPEEYWPYTTIKPTGTPIPQFHFDVEPPAFCYSFAKEYGAIRYLILRVFQETYCYCVLRHTSLLDFRQCSDLLSLIPSNIRKPVARSNSHAQKSGSMVAMPLWRWDMTTV